MKGLKFLSAIALVGLLLTYSGCKSPSGPGESDQDKQLKKLSKVWKCTAATLDGSAPVVANLPSYTYVGTFILTITSTAGQTTFNYSQTGTPKDGTNKTNPWAPSGTFAFGTDFATTMTRDDSLPIQYVVTDNSLQLTFNYTGAGYPGARVNNVTGNWVFTFSPQ